MPYHFIDFVHPGSFALWGQISQTEEQDNLIIVDQRVLATQAQIPAVRNCIYLARALVYAQSCKLLPTMVDMLSTFPAWEDEEHPLNKIENFFSACLAYNIAAEEIRVGMSQPTVKAKHASNQALAKHYHVNQLPCSISETSNSQANNYEPGDCTS